MTSHQLSLSELEKQFILNELKNKFSTLANDDKNFLLEIKNIVDEALKEAE